MRVSLLLLSCAVLICSAAVAAFNFAEREALINDAIEEAKTHAATENRAGESTRMFRTSQDLLFKFKKSSAKAIAQGRASLLFENTIRRAEKKLLEAQRQAMRGSDARVRAEELAKELLHRTGTLLTKQEIAKIYSVSGCGALVEPPNCGPEAQMERTADGTCNNLQNPTFGAAVTALRRIIPPRYEDGVSQLRGTMQSQNTGLFEGPFSAPYPSARLISLEVVEDRLEFNGNLSHILMQWGQFVDHDVGISPILSGDCSGCTFSDVCIPIPIAQNDPTFGITSTSTPVCHPFMRSVPACPPAATPAGTMPPRQQINDITAFIDGSQVYGSSSDQMDSLRDPNNGRLLTGPPIPASGKPSLPSNDDGFIAGDERVNEQTALIVMHTIWVREHNRIADALETMNPAWDREEIFQTARRIVGAEIQKITYKDYLPLILGPFFNQLIGDYNGYNDAIDPGMPNAFTTAAFRLGHSQLRPAFDRLDENFNSINDGPLNLVDAFFNPSQFEASEGTDPILRGLISVPVRRIDEFLNNVLTNHLFQTASSPGMDLASLNMQRGRDHGLPPYMIWKRWAQKTCGVSSDFQNELTAVRLMTIYGSMDTVDLWVGGLAEARLPGSLVGATFACIFANAFGAVRDGDRFYYENDDATALFNADQRAAIESASLSRIICDNADNIAEIQPNAFRLDQDRVSCSEIPEVDLTLWNSGTTETPTTTPTTTTETPTTTTTPETSPLPCVNSNLAYLRISSSAPSSMQRIFSSFSRIFQSGNPILIDEEAVSGTQGSVCLSFRCPEMDGQGRPSQLVVFGPSSCSVTPNQLLPPNLSTFSNIYSANLDETENSESEANGIYADANRCESGSASALDYACSRIQQQNIQSELMELEEAIAQKNGKENKKVQVSLSDPQIPDIVRDMFENGDSQSGIKSNSNKSKLIAMLEGYLRDLKKEENNKNVMSTSHVENHREENSDVELISELEQALNHK